MPLYYQYGYQGPPFTRYRSGQPLLVAPRPPAYAGSLDGIEDDGHFADEDLNEIGNDRPIYQYQYPPRYLEPLVGMGDVGPFGLSNNEQKLVLVGAAALIGVILWKKRKKR